LLAQFSSSSPGPQGNNDTGGSTATGGSSATGGGTASGGTSGSGGSSSTGGGTASGGKTGSGGSSASGGAVATGGTTGGGGSSTPPDPRGDLAKPGDSTTATKGVLNLGDMRLINNRWGSDAIKCAGTTQKVYVNADGTIGWDFNRPGCGGKRADPDYPEVEFGVAPFGNTSSLLTTPAFSSTTLLPIQIKDLTSASATIDNFATTFQNMEYWDTSFEFWISKQNPLTNGTAGVYAEIIAFLAWQPSRLTNNGGWPCDKSGNVMAGTYGYNLCHQSDSWSNNQWRFFNFNVNNGPMATFSGKVDIKAMLDWVMKNYSGFTTDMWLTRIEVGAEVDDNTKGSSKINNLSFEINGTTKSMQVGH